MFLSKCVTIRKDKNEYSEIKYEYNQRERERETDRESHQLA